MSTALDLIHEMADAWREAAAPTYAATSGLPLPYLDRDICEKRDALLSEFETAEEGGKDAIQEVAELYVELKAEQDQAKRLATAIDDAELALVAGDLDGALSALRETHAERGKLAAAVTALSR